MPELTINEPRVREIDAVEFAVQHIGPHNRRVSKFPILQSELILRESFHSDPLYFGPGFWKLMPVHSAQTSPDEATIIS